MDFGVRAAKVLVPALRENTTVGIGDDTPNERIGPRSCSTKRGQLKGTTHEA